MNPRHAAALALVGWYLMVPPIVGDHADKSAPLSRWEMTPGSYDAAVDCRKGLRDSVRDAARDLKDPRIDRTKRNNALQFLDAVCVATDDPRLKENEVNPRHAAALALVTCSLFAFFIRHPNMRDGYPHPKESPRRSPLPPPSSRPKPNLPLCSLKNRYFL